MFIINHKNLHYRFAKNLMEPVCIVQKNFMANTKLHETKKEEP